MVIGLHLSCVYNLLVSIALSVCVHAHICVCVCESEPMSVCFVSIFNKVPCSIFIEQHRKYEVKK